MRKSFILTILLLAFTAVSLCSAHGWVNDGKDMVVIDEAVLYGDKSAAEGITVNCRAQCDYRLFWDTRYTVGENPQISTDFTFSQAEQLPSRDIPYSGIHFDGTFTGYGTGTSGSLDMTDEYAPNQDVASRTGPGEAHTEIVCIKDYYDFYPIRVEFDRPSGFAIDEDTQKLFADYFRIPVYPEHKVEITIEKNIAGNVRRIGLSAIEDSGVYLETANAVTDVSCFFTVSYRTTGGKPLDTSHIAGGYGIYKFPLHNQAGNDHSLTADELQMVFAIDAEQAQVVTLQVNTDKSKLLLVTIEGGSYMLTVIDAETMTQLQKLELLTVEEDNGFGSLYIYDDFIVSTVSDGRFTLLAVDAEGNYEVRFIADFGENVELGYVFSRLVSMDYNGEQLAVVAFREGHYMPQNFCSFDLAVYDQTGLAFAGKYEHSLDRSLAEYSLACLPGEDAPLTVTWGD